MKSPFTCNHENLKLPIAGGARECKDCGHILSNYTLGQLDRAEIAEAACKMANARIEELEGDVEELKKLLELVSPLARYSLEESKQ